MTKNKNGFKNQIYLYAGLLIFLIAFSLFLFYKENNQGFLKINTSQNELALFVDEKEKVFEQEVELSPGNHSIILSKTGFWPWAKEIEITKKRTKEIEPFFIPQNTNGFIINKQDPEYENIISLFETRKTHIDWEKNEYTPKIINDFETEIRTSDFYKDREDVIIIAVQNGVYALEINSDTTPNFQPIYKGNEPIFVKKDNNSIYIKDGELLMEVNY